MISGRLVNKTVIATARGYLCVWGEESGLWHLRGVVGVASKKAVVE